MSGPLGNGPNGRPEQIRVLCVDDNQLVADAIRAVLESRDDMRWIGWLPDARDLLAVVLRVEPDVVLLDVDMPFRDAFEALAELTQETPDVSVIVLSGHTRKDLVERAVEAGAMGYLSKNEGTGIILDAIHRVCQGELCLGTEAESAFNSR